VLESVRNHQEEEFAYQAMRVILLHDLGFLIVVDADGKAVGCASRNDLLKATSKEDRGRVPD
jgi:predicted transcriptional regulator